MTSTTDHIVAQIREALEAGPYEGPWTVEEFQHDGRPCALIVSAEGTIIAEIRGYTDSCGNGENANFIAACNPQNIAVLLQECEDLKHDIERVYSREAQRIADLEAAEAERDALRKVLEPFACIADMEKNAGPADSVMVNVARCRDARTLLSGGKS